jgi:hypothetical protein
MMLAAPNSEHFGCGTKPAGGTVTADGQRFIVVTPVEQAQVTELRRRRKTTSATSVI